MCKLKDCENVSKNELADEDTNTSDNSDCEIDELDGVKWFDDEL